MEHKYALDDLTLEEVLALDLLFELKNACYKWQKSYYAKVCKIQYNKGYNIPYIVTNGLENAPEFFNEAEYLKDKNPDIETMNFKATAGDIEYALICNGIFYTVDASTKDFFAMSIKRGETVLIDYNFAEVKTKDDLERFEQLKKESEDKAVVFVEKTKKLLNEANMLLGHSKIFTHIKFKAENEYIDAKFIYKDIVPGLSASLGDLPIKVDDAYNKRRAYYSITFRERTGIMSLNCELKKPEMEDDLETYLEQLKIYSKGVEEYITVTSILGKLASENDIRFSAKQYN